MRFVSFGVFTCFLITASPVWSKTPQDQEVCFSPDENCAEKLIDFIKSSEKTIDIAIYAITMDTIVEALIEKSSKTKIRIVCDKAQAHGSKSKIGDLLEAGIEIRYGKQKGIMHDKFMVVDKNFIETGSFNYTNRASSANQENQVYISSPSVVSRFSERFEEIWDHATEIDKNTAKPLPL